MEHPSVQQQHKQPHKSHFMLSGNVFRNTLLIRFIDAANSSGATCNISYYTSFSTTKYKSTRLSKARSCCYTSTRTYVYHNATTQLIQNTLNHKCLTWDKHRVWQILRNSITFLASLTSKPSPQSLPNKVNHLATNKTCLSRKFNAEMTQTMQKIQRHKPLHKVLSEIQSQIDYLTQIWKTHICNCQHPQKQSGTLMKLQHTIMKAVCKV